MDEVRIAIEKHNPDVFFISEAEATPQQESLIAIKNYQLDMAGSITLGKSRLIAYRKQSVVNRRIQLEGHDENIIVLENNKSRIVGLYRGFKNYRQPGFDALGYLFELLEEVCKTTKDLTIIGDFNIDPTRDQLTPQGCKLDLLQISNGLFQFGKFYNKV